MKRIIFIIAMLISLEGISQHTAGLKFFGLNKSISKNSATGSSLGLFYRLDISDKFSIQIEPSYSEKRISPNSVHIFEYLEAPELLYFTPVKGNLFFDLHSGINLKYLLQAKSVSENNVFTLENTNKTQLGFIAGSSIGWKPNKVSLSASIRYNYDLTGTFNNGDKINYVSLLFFAGYSF